MSTTRQNTTQHQQEHQGTRGLGGRVGRNTRHSSHVNKKQGSLPYLRVPSETNRGGRGARQEISQKTGGGGRVRREVFDSSSQRGFTSRPQRGFTIEPNANLATRCWLATETPKLTPPGSSAPPPPISPQENPAFATSSSANDASVAAQAHRTTACAPSRSPPSQASQRSTLNKSGVMVVGKEGGGGHFLRSLGGNKTDVVVSESRGTSQPSFFTKPRRTCRSGFAKSWGGVQRADGSVEGGG